MNEGGIIFIRATEAVAGVPGDHAGGKGGEGERGGAAGETGGAEEVSEAERQVHREGTKGKRQVRIDKDMGNRLRESRLCIF